MDTSPNIKEIKSVGVSWVGQVAFMGGLKNEYKILVEKHEWRRPLYAWMGR